MVIGFSVPSESATTYTLTELLPPQGAVSGVANAINDSGQIVGFSTDASGRTVATIWNAAAWSCDLNTLLVQSIAGFELQVAKGINDSGQIVGYGYDSNTGANEAFLLTPTATTATPEPATMLLLGLGLMGVAGVRRKIKN